MVPLATVIWSWAAKLLTTRLAFCGMQMTASVVAWNDGNGRRGRDVHAGQHVELEERASGQWGLNGRSSQLASQGRNEAGQVRGSKYILI